MNINNWNKDTYQEYINYLKSIGEEKYKEFNKKLCSTKYEMLGIRIPILRKIAKNIVKTNYEEFLKNCQSVYFEEVLIEGLVISQIKDDKILNKYFLPYINKIDNWAICDTFCNSLKIIDNNLPKYFKIAKKLALKKQEFTSRVGLIIILNFYVKKEYLSDIFSILDTIESDEYYINMAEAWLLCELYINYEDETQIYLLNNKLNKFTFNKAISKIRESYRVSDEKKKNLNTLKRL